MIQSDDLICPICDLLQRDRMVFHYALDRQIPLAISMAGGYGKDIESTVQIHFQTVQTAVQLQQQY